MRVGLVTALLLLSVLSFAPPAQAQLQPNCAIEVPPLTAPLGVSPGQQVDLELTVRNAGSLAATVTASATAPSAGWSVVGAASQDQTVAAGQSASFRFTFAASEDATADGDARFLARAVCQAPVGGACPAPACAPAEQAQSVVIPLREPQGFRIPGLDRLDFPIEYLVASVILVGLAASVPLLLRNRKARGGLALACPEPLKLVRAGRGASFPIELRNPSKEPLTAVVEVGPVPEGWSAFMPIPEVQLAPGETRSAWLTVRAPPEAAKGAFADVEVRARDPRHADARVRPLRVRAEVDPAAPETPPRG